MTKYSELPESKKEKYRAYARAYQRLRDKDKKNQLARANYAANRESIRAKQNARAALPQNREKARAAAKKYIRESATARKNSLVAQARFRAKKLGLPFTLSKADLVWPEYCPALGIKIDYDPKRRSDRKDSSPSIDRINPAIGYVPNNVAIMSWRANRIKNNATAEELEKIAAFIRTYRQDTPCGGA